MMILDFLLKGIMAAAIKARNAATAQAIIKGVFRPLAGLKPYENQLYTIVVGWRVFNASAIGLVGIT